MRRSLSHEHPNLARNGFRHDLFQSTSHHTSPTHLSLFSIADPFSYEGVPVAVDFRDCDGSYSAPWVNLTSAMGDEHWERLHSPHRDPLAHNQSINQSINQ